MYSFLDVFVSMDCVLGYVYELITCNKAFVTGSGKIILRIPFYCYVSMEVQSFHCLHGASLVTVPYVYSASVHCVVHIYSIILISFSIVKATLVSTFLFT